MTVADMIKAARSRVPNLTVEEVAAALENPRVLVIDVRDPTEIAAEGMIPGALAVPRGMLEFHADPVSPYYLTQLSPDREVICYCKSGGRSVLAAVALQDLGYPDVAHLDGGMNAWRQARRPTTHPAGQP